MGDRPSAVTWIGRAWLVVSVLCLIGGASILLMSIGDADMELGLPAGVMSATAALIAYCSVAFLRLRRWARSVLEAASWLALFYVVTCGGFGVYRFAATGHKAIAGMILSLALALGWGVPLALGLGRDVRGPVPATGRYLQNAPRSPLARRVTRRYAPFAALRVAR